MKAFFVVALLAVAASVPASGKTLALVGGMLFDGSLRDPIADSVVLIDGERIVKVGREGEVAIPADAEIVSTEGMTVLPGLWDLHANLMRLGHADERRWNEWKKGAA